MPYIDQDLRMRHLLAKLAMTSCGTTYSYSIVPSGGSAGHLEPRSGDPDPPHLRFHRRYVECRSDAERERVIKQAADELERLTRAKPSSPERLEDRDARLVRDGEGFTAFEVAVRFRITEREVWAVRRRFGREKDLGRPVLGARLDRAPADERRVRVVALKEQGLSARQIGMLVGVSHVTVLEDLRATRTAA